MRQIFEIDFRHICFEVEAFKVEVFEVEGRLWGRFASFFVVLGVFLGRFWSSRGSFWTSCGGLGALFGGLGGS